MEFTTKGGAFLNFSRSDPLTGDAAEVAAALERIRSIKKQYHYIILTGRFELLEIFLQI